MVLTVAKQMSLQHGNHILVFDNFFNNPDVMQQLKSWGISAVGTVRKNRVGLPKKNGDNVGSWKL